MAIVEIAVAGRYSKGWCAFFTILLGTFMATAAEQEPTSIKVQAEKSTEKVVDFPKKTDSREKNSKAPLDEEEAIHVAALGRFSRRGETKLSPTGRVSSLGFVGGEVNPPWAPVSRITCHSPPQPFWYFETSVIGLQRDVAHASRLMATLGNEWNIMLDAEEAYPGFRAAGSIRIGRMLTPEWGLEYGYLGSDTWDGNRGVADQTPNIEGGQGNLFSPFGEFGKSPILGADYNRLVTIEGESWFDSFELNFRQRLRMPPEPLQLSLLYGLRYLTLDERFLYNSQSGVPLPGGASQQVDVRTENEAFGVQLGTIMEWHVEPRWWIDVRLVAGLCSNHASQTTFYRETGPGSTQRTLLGKNQHGTVVTEASIGVVYYVTSHLATRFGYQMLWMDQIALATQNFEENLSVLRFGPGQIDDDAWVLYHGPFLGIELEW